MQQAPSLNADGFHRYRPYLIMLAGTMLNPRKRRQFDPSDIVQLTLLHAHRDLEQFNGTTEAELLGWLRTILAHRLADAVRKPVHQVEASLDSVNGFISAHTTRLSDKVIRAEQLMRMADALSKLPAAQREAITLHHLQGWKLSEVAEHMDRGSGAVAGLLHRGLMALRRTLEEKA